MDTSTLFSLKGRTALVTGGSRGIGKMIAAGFIAQGAKVYISSRKADVCDATAAELGPNCFSLPHDVSSVAGCQMLADEYFKHEKSLDILVNNAGAAWGEAFETFPESGWDKVMDLNVKSLFFLTQALHGPLKSAASNRNPEKSLTLHQSMAFALTRGKPTATRPQKPRSFNSLAVWQHASSKIILTSPQLHPAPLPPR